MTSKTLHPSAPVTFEAEAPRFSKGFEPSEAFLKRWKETEPKRRIARKLEAIRIGSNQSQAEIAQKMGVDPSYVSRMESSSGPIPKAETIALFAAHCGVDMAYAFIDRKDRGVKYALHTILRDEEVVIAAEDEDEAAAEVATES